MVTWNWRRLDLWGAQWIMHFFFHFCQFIHAFCEISLSSKIIVAGSGQLLFWFMEPLSFRSKCRHTLVLFLITCKLIYDSVILLIGLNIRRVEAIFLLVIWVRSGAIESGCWAKWDLGTYRFVKIFRIVSDWS
jgi:hypothetical protein